MPNIGIIVKSTDADNPFPTDITALSISNSVDSAADTFSCSGPVSPLRKLKPFRAGDIQIFAKDKLLLTGYIERVNYDYSASGNMWQADGRGATGVALEWSAGPLYSRAAALIPGASGSVFWSGPPQYQYKNKTMSQIANVLAAGQIISYRPQPTEVIDFVEIEPGKSVYDVLADLARPRGYIPVPQPNGGLIFFKGAALFSGANVDTIREGEYPNLVSLSSSHDITQRHWRYDISTGDNEAQSVSIATSTDAEMPAAIRGIKIEKSKGEDAPINGAATMMRNRGIVASYGASLTIAGIYDTSGRPWRAGAVVALFAPSIHVNQLSNFFVRSVSYSVTPESITSTLELSLIEMYTGDYFSLGVPPWRV